MKLILILLSVLDLLLTISLLSRCGAELELNPVAAWLYTNFHVIGLLALKVVTVGLALAVYELAVRSNCRKWLCDLFMVGACSMTSIAVVLGVISNVVR